MQRTLAALLILGCLVACGDSPPSSDGDSSRTYVLKVPAGYDGSHAMPLVLAIHGYGGDAKTFDPYFGFDALANAHGFFVAYPDGTVDVSRRRFFTATDACCDFYGAGVDDVAFFDWLLDTIESKYAIDPARIYAVGHSNGGFMSYRLACDLSPRIAAIVSLEGAMWKDPSRCRPSSLVSVLEIHGTDDTVINPAGGDTVDGYGDRDYPPLAQTVGSWARMNGCTGEPQPGIDPGPIDAEQTAPVIVQEWPGCRADVRLWLIPGGTHVPKLTPTWTEAVYGFLMAHPKQAPLTVASVR